MIAAQYKINTTIKSPHLELERTQIHTKANAPVDRQKQQLQRMAWRIARAVKLAVGSTIVARTTSNNRMRVVLDCFSKCKFISLCSLCLCLFSSLQGLKMKCRLFPSNNLRSFAITLVLLRVIHNLLPTFLKEMELTYRTAENLSRSPYHAVAGVAHTR